MSDTPSSMSNDDALARIRIVLVRTSHPGNIGAAARAMYTMGLTQLTLVAPKRALDDEAVALAAGAAHILGVREAAHEAIASAQHGDVAIVFGTEMFGLTNDELARCAIAATIPANPAYASLNLAAAVQVVAYELRAASFGTVGWEAPRFPPAIYDEIEGLYAHAQRTLTALAFLNPAMPKRLLPRLRRLFARAALEREEVNILRGILARVDELIADRNRQNRR